MFYLKGIICSVTYNAGQQKKKQELVCKMLQGNFTLLI